MSWEKRGLIYEPREIGEEIKGGGNYPVPLLLSDRIRVFFAPRNASNQSCIAYLDISRNDPAQILDIADSPVLNRGKLGTFDDCGVQPMQAMRNGNDVWLYYLGWNPGVNILARNNTGLAISTDDGKSFRRAFEGPIMDRTRDEPYFAFTPWILIEDGLWRMWYASGTGWYEVDGKAEAGFEIKYAHSTDGIDWTRPNHRCLPPTRDDEVMCKPNVIKKDGRYLMWFSYRSYRDFRGGDGSYRIGYAESSDGLQWERMDEKGGLDVTPGTWDSDMTCFSSILEVGDRLYLFYNGNGFGQSGFGYAEWNDSE